jgi:hypothetical protein
MLDPRSSESALWWMPLNCQAALLLLVLNGCAGPNDSQLDSEALEALTVSYPMPVSASPDGRFILLKTRHETMVEVGVWSREAQQQIASDRSDNTQLSLTWSPHSDAFAFQSSVNGNRRFELYLVRLAEGRRHKLPGPGTRTAALPLRWNPSATRLAYFSGNEQRQGIGILDLQRGGREESFLPLDAEPRDFVWSPDGAKVAASVGCGVVVMQATGTDRLTVARFPDGNGFIR